jgi:hypothetical protein
MPSLIEDYVQALLNAVADSPIVSASNIQLDKRTNRSGLIRGDLFLGDGSRLYFRELVNIEDLVVRLMYSYHYQDASGHLIFRYDDTPHHTEIDTFPHHKHIEQEENVVACAPPILVGVLEEIGNIFPLNQ